MIQLLPTASSFWLVVCVLSWRDKVVVVVQKWTFVVDFISFLSVDATPNFMEGPQL